MTTPTCSQCYRRMVYTDKGWTCPHQEPQPPTDQGLEQEIRLILVQPFWTGEHLIARLPEANDHVRKLLSLVAREREAAAKEARQQALTDFAEFCHERYLGCGQNNSSPTGFDYSYSGEVVTMAEAYLDTPNQQETKHE